MYKRVEIQTKIIIKLLLILILSSILLLKLGATVTAFGVSTPYLVDDTLRVEPGNNYTYTINIQNSDTEDYYILVNHDNQNIVKLRNETIYAVAGTFDTKAVFDIQIPTNAKIGSTYNVEYSIKPSTRNLSETKTSKIEIRRTFKILIISEISQPTTTDGQNELIPNILRYAGIILISLIVIVSIILVFKRIWNVSKEISEKIRRFKGTETEERTEYTITQASNIEEVIYLLKKIHKEEYSVPHIKKIFKAKITELSHRPISSEEIDGLSKSRLISKLKSLQKEKHIKK